MALHNDYEIRWQNFRAFEDTKWLKLKPLTVLIGPNNAGKSSITAPLLLLSQTMASRDAYTPLVTRGNLINLGTYRDVVKDGDTTNDLTLGFRYHTHRRPKNIEEVGAYPPGEFEVSFSEGELHDAILKRITIYDIYSRKFFRQFRRQKSFALDGPKLMDMKPEERRAIRQSSPTNFLFSPSDVLYEMFRSGPKDEPQTSEAFTKLFSTYLQVIGHTFSGVRASLEDIFYVGPIREHPRRYYEVASEVPRSVGPRGQSTPNLLRSNWGKFSESINKWVSRFEFGESLILDQISDNIFGLQFEEKGTGTRRNIADAGFGASQVLPLIAQAVAAPRSSLTIAEQPEIHLNPRLQCVLADLFAEMIASDHRIVVETHSEHLLLRIRFLVASGVIPKENLAVYYVERKDSVSSIREIPLRENGHIDHDDWPQGFFGETLQLSLALATKQAQIFERDSSRFRSG